ncbi:patatin-like phospholipase family protein [Jatrophihabitans sp. DSM 45814]
MTDATVSRTTSGSRTKALVLGGGGSVGTAWQTGLIAGWNQHGIDLTDADLIVGTSAGAAVGVQVALGHELDRQLDRYRAARARHEAGQATAVLNFDPEQTRRVNELFLRGHDIGRFDKGVREEICRAAREASTISEEQFLTTFKYLKGAQWPANYVCTTVDVDSAEFVALDHSIGGELDHGVAAAVAVPAVYPPITVAGRRYIDGGCLSPTHLDLAAGYDRILFVQMTEVPQFELDAVKQSGAVLHAIEPDAASVAAFGGNLMNAGAAFDAAERGLEQGLSSAEQIATFWRS